MCQNNMKFEPWNRFILQIQDNIQIVASYFVKDICNNKREEMEQSEIYHISSEITYCFTWTHPTYQTLLILSLHGKRGCSHMTLATKGGKEGSTKTDFFWLRGREGSAISEFWWLTLFFMSFSDFCIAYFQCSRVGGWSPY